MIKAYKHRDAALSAAHKVFGVSSEAMLSNIRPEHVCKARFSVYAYMRYMGHPYPPITRAMRKKHHGAVINGIESLRCWFETLPTARQQVYRFCQELGVPINQFVSTVWPTKSKA